MRIGPRRLPFCAVRNNSILSGHAVSRRLNFLSTVSPGCHSRTGATAKPTAPAPRSLQLEAPHIRCEDALANPETFAGGLAMIRVENQRRISS